MRRHELDVLSLVAGLVFLVVAVSHLVGQVSDVAIEGRWVAPALLVGLGVAGLAGALRGSRSRDEVQTSGEEG